MLPDNYFADLAGNLVTTIFNTFLTFLLVPLTSLTQALASFLTNAFTPAA